MPRRRATADEIVLGLMFAGGLGAVVLAVVSIGPEDPEVERVLAPGGARASPELGQVFGAVLVGNLVSIAVSLVPPTLLFIAR